MNMGEPAPPSVPFPRYRPPARQGLLLMAALFGLGSMAAFPFSVWAGLACFIVAVGSYLPWLSIERANRKARVAWLSLSPSHITCDELKKVVKEHPGKLVLHMKTYPGFDSKYISPAAALLNTQTGETIIVDPVPLELAKDCQALGIKTIVQ